MRRQALALRWEARRALSGFRIQMGGPPRAARLSHPDAIYCGECDNPRFPPKPDRRILRPSWHIEPQWSRMRRSHPPRTSHSAKNMASNQKSLEASNETQDDERLRQELILFCQIVPCVERATSTSPATPMKQETEPALETTSAPERGPDPRSGALWLVPELLVRRIGRLRCRGPSCRRRRGPRPPRAGSPARRPPGRDRRAGSCRCPC